MYGYDPINLEKRNVNEWLIESDDNILLIIDKSNINFSKSKSSINKSKKQNQNYNKFNIEKIFCLKRQYLSDPELKNIFIKCVLDSGALMVKESFNSKINYFNIGYYINKLILVDLKNLKPSLLKNKILKLNIKENKDLFIAKEYLSLSQIVLFKPKKDKNIKNLPKEEQARRKLLEKENEIINKKNLPFKKEVYFENILSKALTDYSFQWDAPVNNYLRFGESYFSTSTFKQYYKRYGNTLDEAIDAVKLKIEDLDRVFLEAAPRNENTVDFYYRGMTRPFDNLINIGDNIIIPNFISISLNFAIAIRFSGLPRGHKCCLYKIIVSKGVPLIDMITTTKYINEQETLLPRNLKFELVKIEYINYPTYNPQFKIPISVLKASIVNNDQFKIKTHCAEFYIGELSNYGIPSFIDKTIIKSKTTAKDNNNNPINLDNIILNNEDQNKDNNLIKRCPKGSRKNKLTGLCEKTNNKSKKREKKKEQTNKSNNKLPRCPNGSRRNKVTGNCEKI